MMLKAIVAGVGLVLAATTAQAGEAHYGQTAFAAEGSSTARDVFAPDTPKIELHVQLVDVPKGASLTADWIAEKAAGAPENYKIDSATLVANGEDEATFSLSKPDAGWPVGAYRVELSIGDAKQKSLPFTVAQ